VQIIVVSRHLKSARTITIMPRHVLGTVVLFVALVLLTAFGFSMMSLHFRLPVVEEILSSIQQQETRKTRDYITNNLELMATRLGELQGRVLQLDSLGERVSNLAGVKASRKGLSPEDKPGQGGPFLPVAMSATELHQEIERLAMAVDQRTDELAYMEFKLLEKRVEQRLTPTTLPVRNAIIGSAFGYRNDPFAGLRSRHDGLDFSAPTGTPVSAAADGVVLAAFFHPEYGNMIDIDHGDGLSSRYAHLATMVVAESKIVRRGEKIGTVGSTGRSTGPHLHFEVHMLGVPQNPAAFLKRGEAFAHSSRR
jgi:murein DD-endopeptidase MepM/ murein hydrolase activator NlpD